MAPTLWLLKYDFEKGVQKSNPTPRTSESYRQAGILGWHLPKRACLFLFLHWEHGKKMVFLCYGRPWRPLAVCKEWVVLPGSELPKSRSLGPQQFLLNGFSFFSFWTRDYNVMKPQCRSVQFSSVAQLCPTLCNPMDRSTPGLAVDHQLP